MGGFNMWFPYVWWDLFQISGKIASKAAFFLANKMCWKLYLIQALRVHTIQQLTSFLNLGQDPPPTNGVCATKRDLAVECFFLKQMHFQCFFEMPKTRFWWFWCTSMATDTDVCFSQKHADITQQHPEMFIISAFESFLILTLYPPTPTQHPTTASSLVLKAAPPLALRPTSAKRQAPAWFMCSFNLLFNS